MLAADFFLCFFLHAVEVIVPISSRIINETQSVISRKLVTFFNQAYTIFALIHLSLKISIPILTSLSLHLNITEISVGLYKSTASMATIAEKDIPLHLQYVSQAIHVVGGDIRENLNCDIWTGFFLNWSVISNYLCRYILSIIRVENPRVRKSESCVHHINTL